MHLSVLCVESLWCCAGGATTETPKVPGLSDTTWLCHRYLCIALLICISITGMFICLASLAFILLWRGLLSVQCACVLSCVCLHMCRHARSHYMQPHTQMRSHTRTRTCEHIRTHSCTETHTHAPTQAHSCICIQTHTHVHTHTHTHTRIYRPIRI